MLEVPASNQSDEFGEIIRNFNAMLATLDETRQALEQRVEDSVTEVAQSERRLRAIIDNSPACIYLKDRDSRVILINKAYKQRYDVIQEQAFGEQGHELLGHDIVERLRSHDQKVLETGEPVETETESKIETGESRVTELVKFPIWDQSDKIIGIGGFATDITERKKMSEIYAKASWPLNQPIELNLNFSLP